MQIIIKFIEIKPRRIAAFNDTKLSSGDTLRLVFIR